MRSITVSAKSEIKVPPDEVVLSLTVYTCDAKILAAKHQNDVISAAVLALAPKHSIPDKDVQITNYDVSLDYGRDDRRESKPIAYSFRRSIEVRLTDFTKIEPFLADAFDAGLTQVYDLTFPVSNQREHQFEARELAVTYAKEKAEHLTSLTGMVLGSPIRIEEDIEDNWRAGGMGGMARSDAPSGKRNECIASDKPRIVFASLQEVKEAHADPGGSKDALIAPGQILIKAHVTVEFEMTPK